MKPRHPRGFALERPRLSRWAPPLFGHGMALFGAGTDVAAPRWESRSSDQCWGKQQMSVFRLIAGVIGLAFVAAAATAVLGIGTEVRAELAPILAKESPPAMASSDGWACAREPWPYGCQWQTPPVKRVFVRPSGPS